MMQYKPGSIDMTNQPSTLQLPGVNFKDSGGVRSLHLGTAPRQAVMRLAQPDAIVWEFMRQMMGWLLFMEPDSVSERHAMQLGLGGGTLTKVCRNRLNMKTTAIELNPAVIAICRESFALPPDDEKLQVIEDDAGQQIKLPKWTGCIDALQIDLFDELVSAPVFDDEAFFWNCRNVLTKDGCITFNVIGKSANIRQTLHNIGAAFGHIAVWSFGRCSTGNTVLLAQRLPSRPSTKELTLRAAEIQRRWGFSAKEWPTSLESWVL